jgi:sterol desaturase/sphingolipid hydroxylase (fatty acid hydroxylase superfamily)
MLVAFAAGVPPTTESIQRFFDDPTRAVRAQPLWVQAFEALLVGDVIGYWVHRAFHRQALWKLHAVHHSSTQVDWLSSVRLHPFNDVLMRVPQALAILLLGFPPTVLVTYVPFFAFYATFLHANVPWNFGPLRYVIASPAFHRWHHTTQSEGRDRNFAGLFPFLDLLFGTFYLPKGRQPRAFGVEGEAVPEGVWRQMVYPFRRVRRSIRQPLGGDRASP